MALVTAYLARTAQLRSASGAGFFSRIAAFCRTSAEIFVEARALERSLMRKYPFTDV